MSVQFTRSFVLYVCLSVRQTAAYSFPDQAA